MIHYPQQTLIKRGENIDKIIHLLTSAVTLKNGVLPLTGSGETIYGVTESKTVPAFNLPIDLIFSNKTVTVVDLRKISREYTLSPYGDSYTPIPSTEASFLTNLAALQRIWINEIGAYSSFYNQCAKIYAHWVASTVRTKTNLPFEDEQILRILACYFFLTRGVKNVFPSKEEYAVRISKIIVAEYHEILGLLTKISSTYPHLATIEDFCNAVKQLTTNPKLAMFTPAILLQYLFGSWFGGANPKEFIGVGLEYPPMFIGLVYRAMNERLYKDTILSKKINEVMKPLDKERLLMSIDRAILVGRNTRA